MKSAILFSRSEGSHIKDSELNRGVLLWQQLKETAGTSNDAHVCQKLKETSMIAQKIIQNPMTFEQRKFDLRMYLIVYSHTPLRYELHSGFARVATETYVPHMLSVLSTAKVIFDEYSSAQ